METIRCGDSWSVNRLAVARSGYGVNDRFVVRAENAGPKRKPQPDDFSLAQSSAP
jgi:hypothetical protein